MNRVLIGFFVVIVVAGFFRMFQLNTVPSSLNWDEVSFGYNAYSLLLTGRDEYGTIAPLEFKSVGDYKAPMYIYLLVAGMGIFGANDEVIRLVPAILATLATGVFYLIAYKLTRRPGVAFFAGLMLSISPWHLQFSRAGADVAVGTFFTILGLGLFLNKRIGYAAMAFAGAMYSYFAERFFVPVFCVLLVWYGIHQLKLTKKQLITGFVTGLVCLLPLVGALSSSGAQNKILITTLFGYSADPKDIEIEKTEDKLPLNYSLFHNPVINFTKLIGSRYINHFSPDFLFISGTSDNRQRIHKMGMAYWFDLIGFVSGLGIIAVSIKKKQKTGLFIGIWLALTPLAASITKDPVHARRAFNMVYPFVLITSLGALKLVKKINLVGKLGYGVGAMWCIGFYFVSYYIFTPLRTAVGSAGWQYGYKQLVEFVTPLAPMYEKIVVDTYYQGPYIFFLWYQKYPPAAYHSQANLSFAEPNGLGEGTGYDKFEFRKMYWPADRGEADILYAGAPERIPLKDIDAKQAKIVNTLLFPDGKEAYYIVETY